MANPISWDAYPGATTYLSTELNSLADGANKLGAAIDDSTDLNMLMAVQVYLATQGSARDSDARIEMYLLQSVDGTNYTYGDDSTDPPKSAFCQSFPFDAAVTARYVCIKDIPVYGKFKMLFMNETGPALAASGNLVKYQLYMPEAQ